MENKKKQDRKLRYIYSKELSLQVELSTVCNAFCPGCVRTDRGTLRQVKPFIPKAKFLDTSILIDFISKKESFKIRKIEFCGNIDEPFLHPHFLNLLEEIERIDSSINIIIHTNGGIKKRDDYYRAGKILSRMGEFSNIKFSIDGLQDTNHLYRKNVQWPVVIENLEACIASGARVIWQMLVFPWNAHQVKSVESLSKEMGCYEFWLRPDRSDASVMGLDKILERRKNGRVKQNRSASLRDYQNYAKNIDLPISCSFREDQKLFISWEGRVWPCCFMSNIYYGPSSKVEMFKKYVIKGYDNKFNSLYEKKMEDILKHDFFAKDLVQSWSVKGDRKKWRCTEKCSVGVKRDSDGKTDDKKHYRHVVFSRSETTLIRPFKLFKKGIAFLINGREKS